MNTSVTTVEDCSRYDRFEKLLVETQQFTIRKNEGRALARHLSSCMTWYQYLQIIGIPIVTTVGWLLIPLAVYNALVTYWVYTMVFLAFYWVWIQGTGLYFFHHFVLPGMPLVIRIGLVVLVFALEAGYWWLVRYVLHVEHDKMVYTYPGWTLPAFTSIAYLFYGIYLSVKTKQQQELSRATTSSVDGAPIDSSGSATNPFDTAPVAAALPVSGSGGGGGGVIASASSRPGSFYGNLPGTSNHVVDIAEDGDDDDADSVKASSSDDEDDGLEPDDDLLTMLSHTSTPVVHVRVHPDGDRHQEEDDDDESAHPLLDSPFVAGSPSHRLLTAGRTASSNPFDDHADEGDGPAAGGKDPQQYFLPQMARAPVAEHHASLRRFVRGITHHAPSLTEADVKNPLRNALLGSIFLLMLAGIWYLNIAMYTVFSGIKGDNGPIRFVFSVGFQAMAFVIKQIVVKFVMQLPRRRQVKSIARFGLDTLFFLYYRALFVNVPDVGSFVGMMGGGLIVELLLYPLRMTRLYTRVFEAVREFFKYRLFCLKRKVRNEDIPPEIRAEAQYRQHKRDLALDYYFHNLARMMSVICLIIMPVVLRYSYNSPIWQFRNGTEESGGIPEDRFVMLMIFYVVQFVLEGLIGLGMKYLIFGRLFNVDADLLGSLLCSSLAVRICLIGFTGHFLHDIWYFTMDIVPRL